MLKALAKDRPDVSKNTFMIDSSGGAQLADYILTNGGANSFLHNGAKITSEIVMQIRLSASSEDNREHYFTFTPRVDERFMFHYHANCLSGKREDFGTPFYSLFDALSRWMVYHFHDTSAMSPMRRAEIVEDYHDGLRHDASNIAPFLLYLKNEKHERYKRIVNAVRLVIPFFDDFRLDVLKLGEAQKVKLSWQQKGSDYPMQPYHLSDGSLRFICLATALLQPDPPSTIIIDEPELGLHPLAIAILAELIHCAATRIQVIAATQSPALIDHFAIDDIIVANRKEGASTFTRLIRQDFSVWLENYSVGELWKKNVIDGGPVYE